MDLKHFTKSPLVILLITNLLLGGCSDELLTYSPSNENTINLLGEINQEYVTRANDDGFADGDQMGVYIVDYDGIHPGTLSASGNRANNALFQFDAKSLRWSCGTPFYWKDNTTHIDVYGYYPYNSAINDIAGHPFTVADDQRPKDDEMSGYEKSDFLWAKASDVSPTTDLIRLTYSHRMAGVKVTLQRGEGISQTEWEKVEHFVTVDNTIRTAEIDLTTGSVTATGKADKIIVMADQGGDVYRAVVVPQTITAGTRLIGITIDGMSYGYTRTQELTLTAGKLHNFTLKIDKKDSGDYELELVGEEILPWENDNITHGFFEYEYTVVHTTEPGTLKQTIEEMGKDFKEIKNLKIIGPLNTDDFVFMRDEMSSLAMLNMKEVETKNILVEYEDGLRMDNAIPEGAFYGKGTLRRLVLPDGIERIGRNAFREIGLDANSSIILPSHLKRIDEAAFGWIGEAGELVLNDSLEYVGNYAFGASSFTCALNLPNTLKYIGDNAFGYSGNNPYKITNTAQHFRLPDNLEYLGINAFEMISFDEVGEIIIPKCMTEVTRGSFPTFTRGAKITFHDGVKKIKNAAFYGGYRFINHVVLPEGLTELEEAAFWFAEFKAGLTLPSTLRKLNSRCLWASGLEDLVLPEGIAVATGLNGGMNSCTLPSTCEVIAKECFSESTMTAVKINKNCSFIDGNAFSRCGKLKQVICLNPEPPRLSSEFPFEGCNLDMLVLEVPAQSVELYRNTPGWNRIRFISAYHELAVGVSDLTCLEGGVNYETLVRSEGEWEVAECPSWCHVSPNRSDMRRTEVNIKVDATSHGTEREGRIVFKLKKADYTAYTTVKQTAYEKEEDKEIVLQTASAGGKEIPVFIVGEGFDVKSIKDGTYMKAMTDAYNAMFSIEPMKTYKNYFTVSTAVAVSPDEGTETVTSVGQNKFGMLLDEFGIQFDFNRVKEYAKKVSNHITNANIGNALIIVVPKHDDFIGLSQIDNDGTSLALCCYYNDSYPYDFRGIIQHFAVGKAFGRLGNESILHYQHIKGCKCMNCNGYNELRNGQAKGWYQNVSLSGGLNSVPWKHLVFDPRYSDIVDVHEGAWNHLRGVYRSENMSVMNTYIQYFNTWSRELLVRRIMQLADKSFSFEDFASKDSRDGMPN